MSEFVKVHVSVSITAFWVETHGLPREYMTLACCMRKSVSRVCDGEWEYSTCVCVPADFMR